jgi:hypothetical protein
MVQELSEVLAEERDKAAAFEEVFCTAVREVRVVSAGVAHLTQAALDAEERLSAGIAHADGLLRQPGGAGNQAAGAVSTNQDVLPEIAELIRLGNEAMAVRMASEATGPIGAFRAAAAAAAEQVKEIGDTAAAFGALEAAGRETAVANAKIVTRLNAAAAQIDASVATLPEAVASVTEGARQAADIVAEASLELRANGAALETSSNESRHAAAAMQVGVAALTATAQALESTGAELGETLITSLAEMPAAAATVIAAADQAVNMLIEAAGELQADGVALEGSRSDTRQATAAMNLATEALAAKAHGLEQAGSQFGKIAAQALVGMPAAAAAVTAAAKQVSMEGAALEDRGQEAQRAMAALAQETEKLRASGQTLNETGHQTISAVTQAAEMAVAKLAAVIGDAAGDRETLTNVANRTAALESIAGALADNASRLDEAGQRNAAAGERVASRLDISSARSETVLQALPDVAAAVDAAAAGLRQETSALTTAARQVSAAVNAATSAVTGVAARAETAAASLDAVGRQVSSASAATEARVERLAAVTQRAETQASLLPDAAKQVTDATARLQLVTDAAAGKLDSMASALPAEQTRQEMLAAIADIGASARRVEGALMEHDRIWPSVVASITQVEAAAAAVAQAAGAGYPSVRSPVATDPAQAPADLVATLRHFEEVVSQSQILLQQADALAEAVLSGKTAGLPPDLADRTPGLLADIDTTTRRLRSVATALALASDGVATKRRRRA